jgi:hypothetical protein
VHGGYVRDVPERWHVLPDGDRVHPGSRPDAETGGARDVRPVPGIHRAADEPIRALAVGGERSREFSAAGALVRVRLQRGLAGVW